MMKKMFGAILVACTMACTVVAGMAATGCNKNKVTEFVMPEGGYDGSAVTISFYNTMGQNLRPVLASAVQRFNDIYPNITVVTDSTSGDYDTIRDKITIEISGGKQPNVAYCYPDHVALYNQSNVVLALDNFLPDGEYKDMTVNADTDEPMGLTQAQVDDYIKDYYDEGKAFGDGKMYTLPFAKSTEVLYYNKTFFEKEENKAKGLKVPKTWEEMKEACRIIKEIDPDSTPLGYDSEANMFITMCEQYGSDYTSATGDKYLFDNAKNREFVQMFKDWYDLGYFTTKSIHKSYTSNLFKEQKSYMSIGSSAGASNQVPKMTDGKAAFEADIVQIPQVDPAHPKTISQGPSVCIFKKSNPQEVIASWLLVKFLTTDVAFQASFASVSGYTPVLNSVFENKTYADHLEKDADGYATGITYTSAKVCKKLVEEQAYYYSPAFNGSSKARDNVGILMQAVFEGTKTIDKAFEDAINDCKYFG